MLKRNLPSPPLPPLVKSVSNIKIKQPPSFVPPLIPQQTVKTKSTLIAEIETELASCDSTALNEFNNLNCTYKSKNTTTKNINILKMNNINSFNKIEFAQNIMPINENRTTAANFNQFDNKNNDEDHYSISHKFADFDDDDEFDIDINENFELKI